MRTGDLIRYVGEGDDMHRAYGLIVKPHTDMTVPCIITILWDTGELENVFEDEVELVNSAIELVHKVS